MTIVDISVLSPNLAMQRISAKPIIQTTPDGKQRIIQDEIVIAEGLTDPPKPIVKGRRHKI